MTTDDTATTGRGADLRNHVYRLNADGIVVSEPTTIDALERARDGASMVPLTKWVLRTCWDCNAAHASFLADGGMGAGWGFHCAFGCGRWFYDNTDITEYDHPAPGTAGDEQGGR